MTVLESGAVPVNAGRVMLVTPSDFDAPASVAAVSNGVDGDAPLAWMDTVSWPDALL